jgi:hypothetical protein
MRSVRAPAVKSAAKITINTKVFMSQRQNLLYQLFGEH